MSMGSRKTARLVCGFAPLLSAVGLGLSAPASALPLPCPNNHVCETYTYDVHGRLVQVEDVKDTSGTEATDTVVYTYDDAGNRIKKQVTTS